jgi:hypothetical protein
MRAANLKVHAMKKFVARPVLKGTSNDFCIYKDDFGTNSK